MLILFDKIDYCPNGSNLCFDILHSCYILNHNKKNDISGTYEMIVDPCEFSTEVSLIEFFSVLNQSLNNCEISLLQQKN